MKSKRPASSHPQNRVVEREAFVNFRTFHSVLLAVLVLLLVEYLRIDRGHPIGLDSRHKPHVELGGFNKLAEYDVSKQKNRQATSVKKLGKPEAVE